jgi:hypothetical protein
MLQVGATGIKIKIRVQSVLATMSGLIFCLCVTCIDWHERGMYEVMVKDCVWGGGACGLF